MAREAYTKAPQRQSESRGIRIVRLQKRIGEQARLQRENRDIAEDSRMSLGYFEERLSFIPQPMDPQDEHLFHWLDRARQETKNRLKNSLRKEAHARRKFWSLEVTAGLYPFIAKPSEVSLD